MKPLLLCSPPAHPLAPPLAKRLDAETGAVTVHRFPDGESRVRIDTRVAGRDVVVLAGLNDPDAKFLPLHFLARTARELGARSCGLVAPYFPYLRQDHRFRDGEAVSAPLFAELINNDFDWLVTAEPHLHRIARLEDIFTIPARVVSAAPAIAAWITANVSGPLIVGPDAESAQWVNAVAAAAGAPGIVLEKIRSGDHAVEVSRVPANAPRGRHPVLVDDIISSGHTLIEAAARLREASYPSPAVAAVHGLFAGGALEQLREAGITKIATCNSVAHSTNEIDLSEGIAEAVSVLLRQ